MAMLRPDTDAEAAALMTVMTGMNQILEPLRMVGAFADLTVASGVNAISGGGNDAHDPMIVLDEKLLRLYYHHMGHGLDFEFQTPFEDGFDSSPYVRPNAVTWLVEVATRYRSA